MTIETYFIIKKDEKEWNDYVLNSNNSSFYHLTGWKNIVNKSYGHKPFYLIAKKNGDIKGILPIVLMESRIFGKKLVSVPFAPYGGVCADDLITENVLINDAKTLANELDVDYLEFRNYKENEFKLNSNDSYYSLILKLNSNPELLWNNFRKSMRRYIGNAMKNNLVITTNPIYINEFYKLYSNNMKDLGTPVHSYTFFKNLLEEFSENTNITIVQYNNIPIAAVLLLYFKDVVIYGWGSSDRKYLQYSPNYILFWELIKQSCEKKYNYFDFGRSQKTDGTFLFKKGWGGEPRQLYYQYYSKNSKRAPDMSKSNSTRQKFAMLWKNLPIPIANKLGPFLRSNIP